MKPRHPILITVVLAHVAMATCSAQTTRVDWFSLTMGYGDPGAGNTIMRSLVGQTFVGLMRQSDTRVMSGFLADTLFGGHVVAVGGQEGLPLTYSLEQNYPNPFNPSTTVHFEIPLGSHVVLRVYNVLGQEVMTPVDEEKPAGRYRVTIDASDLASGAYFYRLQAGDFVSTRKFVILR